MFANCQGGGINQGAPDVCLTPQGGGAPPAPVPYVNVSDNSMAVGFVPNVLLSAGYAHNVMTTIPLSSGDEPGAQGGVASGMVIGPTKFVGGSAKVLFGGQPATRQGSPTQQNGGNAQGVTLTPGQGTVLLLG